MKRLTALFLLLCLLSTLLGCSVDTAQTPQADAAETPATIETTDTDPPQEPEPLTLAEPDLIAVYQSDMDFPVKVICTGERWWMLLGRVGEMHYQVSVSDGPNVINPIYDTPEECVITNFTATENYVAWCEEFSWGYRFNVYDPETGIVTPFHEIHSPYLQPIDITIYEDFIYYGFIDYDNYYSSVMRYYINTGETESQYGTFFFGSNSLQGMNSNDAELIFANMNRYEKTVFTRLDMNLQGDWQNLILPEQIGYVRALDYDIIEDCYAVYYETRDASQADVETTLGIYRPGDNEIKPIAGFPTGSCIYHNDLEARNGTLFWINMEGDGSNPDKYQMVIYDYLTDTMRTHPGVVHYSFTEDGMYYLCVTKTYPTMEVQLFFLPL